MISTILSWFYANLLFFVFLKVFGVKLSGTITTTVLLNLWVGRLGERGTSDLTVVI
jgi:hypothetical protein